MINLSIIIPVFNASNFIDACIRTCLNTSRRDYEIILVDDGSTDDTLQICEKLAKEDSRLRVVHKENGGVSSARNIGLEQALGDWICFVDADDCLTNDFFEVSLSCEYDLYCFNWKYSDGDHENELLEDGCYENESLKSFLSNHLAYFVFRTPWAKCFKKSIINTYSCRFDERFKLGEDHLFVLEYLAHCKSICTRNVCSYIYLRPAQTKYSLSIEQSQAHLAEFYKKYHTLNIESLPLLSLMEYYYFLRINKDTLLTRIKWEGSLIVRLIQNKCVKLYGLKNATKIYIRRPFALVYYLINTFR